MLRETPGTQWCRSTRTGECREGSLSESLSPGINRLKEAVRRRRIRIARAEQSRLDKELDDLLCKGVIDWARVVSTIQEGGDVVGRHVNGTISHTRCLCLCVCVVQQLLWTWSLAKDSRHL